MRQGSDRPSPVVSQDADESSTSIVVKRGADHTRLPFAVAGLAAVAIAAGLLLSVGDDGSSEAPIKPDRGTTTTALDNSLDPLTGLRDGDSVDLTLPVEPADDAVIAQCEEQVRVSDAAPWCDTGITVERLTDGPAHFRVTVRRTIQTSNGIIDCAERAGRCVIGVRSGSHAFTAAMTFRGDLGPIPTPTISLDHSEVADGDTVRVLGDGFEPDIDVVISQCLQTLPTAPSEPVRFETCDSARVVRLTTDAAGHFDQRMIIYREVFKAYEGWTACSPCMLQSVDFRRAPAFAPIDIGPTSAPIRPVVEIVPRGPYEPGQRVRIVGRGFQAITRDVSVGYCRFVTDHPETEIAGGAPDYAECGTPEEGFAAQPDQAGNFTIDEFPLPSGRPGDPACTDPNATCGLAWHPSEGSLPAFVTLFDLTGAT